MSTSPVCRPPRQAERAFTLVELLVSMAVLTLLVVAVTQIVGGTASIATGNRKHIDADSQARLVFDRMGLDFSRMLKRQDADFLFAPQIGNDKIFFYSEAPAYFDSGGVATSQSSLSLIGYRVDSAVPAVPTLSRLGKGLTWDESPGPTPGSIVFLTPSSTPSASPTPIPDPASTLAGHWADTLGTSANNYSGGKDVLPYHVIADQVCRLEICFLLKPLPATATAAAQPAIYSLLPYRTGVPLHDAVNGLQDVRAIVVALAILDRSSREIAPDLSHMSTALRDIATGDLTTSPPTLMAKVWQDEIDQGKLATDARIPAASAAQVRIYQRHFYLDTQ